jgi:hypothetical protein
VRRAGCDHDRGECPRRHSRLRRGRRSSAKS